ncbi:MAG: ABC transporter permease, partial [Calditrichia bacterium]|nr:ABC transporter permease [Calditrichia bacterium]
VIIGIISGSYPAFFLSSFNAAPILKGNLRSGKKGSRLRKLLVISQFSLAIILIVFTISLKRQNENFHKMNYGFNRNNVLSVKLTDDARKQLSPVKKNLKNNTDIISVTASNSIPIIWQNEMQVIPEGKSKEEAWTINVYGVDYDFIETMDITLLQGRSHLKEYDDNNNYVINETMIRQLQWENPLGKQLTIEGKTGSVIGVVKDFQFLSANRVIIPSVLRLDPENLNHLLIRHSSSKKPAEVAEIAREQWASFLPGLPFESQTLVDFFYQSYKGDRIFFFLFTFVDFVAVFVSCLGLLGLTSYAVEKRTKEIGIRKTLGASVAGIIKLLVKEFMLLVMIANIIGIPLAWYFVESLLSYRVQVNKITLGADILIFTVLVTLITAVIAVSSQTWKAARANPVESLKYE